MGEAVKVSAPRAGPAAGFRIRAFRMGHFIYDAAFDAARWFAADEFFLLYVLHKILSIQKPSIIAGFWAKPGITLLSFCQPKPICLVLIGRKVAGIEDAQAILREAYSQLPGSALFFQVSARKGLRQAANRLCVILRFGQERNTALPDHDQQLTAGFRPECLSRFARHDNLILTR